MVNTKKKKKLLIILFVLAILLPVGITYSKYIKTVINNYILEAKNFYFNSDKLSSSNPTYNINNWSGVGNFTIQFELNNEKNNILYSSSDITYTLNVTCDNDITCSLSNTSGTIYTTEHKDSFVLTVTPQRAFNDNESVHVTVTAQSTSPYEKTLGATFVITVGKRGISYEITDKANQPYLNFTITNAITSYKVRTAFDTYSVGDEISSETYLALSDTNKANCASQIVTLTFDPNIVILDTTSSIMDNSTKAYTTVNNVSYISSITFNVEAMSSTEIRFYKKDTSQNYTYPITNNTSIITFSSI